MNTIKGFSVTSIAAKVFRIPCYGALAAFMFVSGMQTVSAQQPIQPMSIDAWLRAEQGNENLQSAYQRLRQSQNTWPNPNSPPSPTMLSRQVYSSAQTQAPSPSKTPRNTREDTSANANNEDWVKEKINARQGSHNRVYIVGRLGNATLVDSDYEFSTATLTANHSPLGLYTSGAVGIELGSGFSTDVELSYQYAEVDDLQLTGSGLTFTNDAASGDTSALSALVNVNWNSAGPGKSSAYLTGGLGISRIEINDVQGQGGTAFLGDDALVFAYQLGFGMMFPLADSLTLDLGYRFFGTSDADMKLSNLDFTTNVQSNTLLVGLKYGL